MKHLKVSYTDLNRLFRNNITIREIAEPLVSFESDRPAPVIKEFMEKKDFDVVGVRQDGDIIGYVERKDLHGEFLSDNVQKFTEEHLLNENASLHTALEILKDRDWAFVRFLNYPVGIVTRGDLQKQPVRIWLFGMISLLEMRLNHRLREAYPNNSWIPYLKENRIEAAKNYLALKAKENEAIDLVECLQLCDKREIYRRSDLLKSLRPFESKGKWDDFMEDVETLRNSIAHSNSVAFKSWPEIAKLVDDMETCLTLLEEAEPAGSHE
jgi:CBS domain-containing protein